MTLTEAIMPAQIERASLELDSALLSFLQSKAAESSAPVAINSVFGMDKEVTLT